MEQQTLAGRVTASYFTLALGWILGSDWLLAQTGYPWQSAQTNKGALFVLLTAGLLFLGLRRWEGQLRREAATRHAAQAALAESESRFRQLAGSIQEVFWLTDLDKNQMLYVSPAYETVWGRSCASLLAAPRNWLEAIHPKDRQEIVDALPTQVLGTYDKIYRIVTPSGEVRWIHDRAFPVLDEQGRPFRMAGVACDVTAQHVAALALQASEERYRQLVDLSPEGIFTQLEGTCVFANPAFERLVGRDPVGIPVLELLHPNCRAAVQERIAEIAQGYAQLQPTERDFMKPDGTAVPTEVLAVPYASAGRQGALVLVRDIAERKQAELERRELENKLRHAQKMQAVGQLAGGIAHDFNNLLTVISGNLQLLQVPDPENAALVNEIASAAQRAADLTRQLLTFSRKQVLQQRPLDLNDALLGVTRLLRRVLGEQIQLDTACAPDLPPIQADPGMVEQVIMNLAVNARDAMEAGGQLVLETSLKSWEAGPAVLPGHPGRYVCLEVRDTGLGMDAETLRHCCEPFFTTKQIGQGTGLGLATVYGIVEQHGGALELDSGPGQGTTVRVYWPLAVQAPHTEPEPPVSEPAPPARETILVAEDEPAVAELLKRILARAGYRVLLAHSGPAALELWAQERESIQALITDVVMPGGVSGLELGRRLQAENAALKVIYCSGYTPRESLQDAGLRPGERFLQKPFAPGVLTRQLRECLHG